MEESAKKIVDEGTEQEKEQPKEVDDEGVKKDNETFIKKGHKKMNKHAKSAFDDAETTIKRLH